MEVTINMISEQKTDFRSQDPNHATIDPTPQAIKNVTMRLTLLRGLISCCETKNTSKNSKKMQLNKGANCRCMIMIIESGFFTTDDDDYSKTYHIS
jgi:hypothetical protein